MRIWMLVMVLSLVAVGCSKKEAEEEQAGTEGKPCAEAADCDKGLYCFESKCIGELTPLAVCETMMRFEKAEGKEVTGSLEECEPAVGEIRKAAGPERWGAFTECFVEASAWKDGLRCVNTHGVNP